MKKLMTMLAAVATAFGLYAADEGFLSGAGFDTSDAVDPAKGHYTWLYNTESKTGDFVTGYWTGTENAVWTAGKSDAGKTNRPLQYQDDVNRKDDGFLTISSKPEEPVVQKIGAKAVTIDAEKGLYFDGLVQFTSFEDEAPVIDPTAKIALFPMVDDPEATPQVSHLIVAAQGTEETNLWKTAATIDDGWHRVTIKMINNIKKTGTAQAGFVVYVDGTAVSCTDAKDAFDPDDLTAEAKSFYNKAQLFGSLVTDTAEITDVAFGGKGAIDEIAFTETAPDFAESPIFCKVTGGEGIASFMADGLKWEGGAAIDAKIENGKVVVTAITADTGYFIPAELVEQTLDATKGGIVTVTGAKELGATVVINDVPMYFETAAAALAELNDATKYSTATDAALTLNADSGALSLDNANITLTLDLAGKTIESKVAGTAAINVAKGAILIIDDSDENKMGLVKGYEITGDEPDLGIALSGAELGETEDDLRIQVKEGTFDGGINASIKVLEGGPAFNYAANAPLWGDDCPINYIMADETKTLVKDNKDEPTYWVVGTPPVTTYTVTIKIDDGITAVATNFVQGGEEKVFTASGSFTVNEGDGVSVKYTCSETGYGPSVETESRGNITEDVELGATKVAIKIDVKVNLGAHLSAVVSNKTQNTEIGTATETKTFDDAAIIGDVIVAYYTADEGYKPTATSKSTDVNATDVENGFVELNMTAMALKYSITYTTGNGAVVTNGVTEYTIETETFNLPVAADIDMQGVTGVEFAGWTNETGTVTQVQKGTMGNLEFFAKWETVQQPLPDPIKGGDIEAQNAYKDWAAKQGDKIKDPTAAGNVDRFILGLDADATDAAVKAKLDTIITADFVNQIVANGFENVDFSALKKDYPYAEFSFVVAEEIPAETGKSGFYRLSAKLRSNVN